MSKSPEKEVVPSKLVPQRLSISMPELLPRQNAIACPSKQPPPDRRNPEIQPDDGVGPSPDDVADSSVVAIHYPPIGSYRLSDASTKLLPARHGPTGRKVQFVQLDVGDAKRRGQRPCHRGLAGSGRAHDHYPVSGLRCCRPAVAGGSYTIGRYRSSSQGVTCMR